MNNSLIIYVLVYGDEWEDIIIFLSLDEALKESVNYQNNRIEIFSKTKNSEYIPTYNNYKNGKYTEIPCTFKIPFT